MGLGQVLFAGASGQPEGSMQLTYLSRDAMLTIVVQAMLQDIVAAHVRGASREAESLRELDMHVAATLPVQYRLTVAQCRRMPRTEVSFLPCLCPTPEGLPT